ncbi:MAG: hypothetical protein ABI972_00025 [Acidobacteriota bacterium]
MPIVQFIDRRVAPWSLGVVLQFTILILGRFGLALPGLVLALLGAWLAIELIRHRRWLLHSETWVDIAMRVLLPSGRTAAIAYSQSQLRHLRRMCEASGPWVALFAAYFLTHALFAAGNLRFLDSENYARSLSLAVLSSGQPWQVDTSIPLLLPIHLLSALPATAVVRYSGPLVSVLFILAVAFVAFEYTRSRHAALLASALCMVAPIWRGGGTGSELGAAEFSATFAVLGIGLARRSHVTALLAGVLGISICAEFPFSMTVIGGISCAVIGAGAERSMRLIRRDWRPNLRALGVAASVPILAWCVPLNLPDGPHQYEAAARACDRIARSLDRNTWLLVSSPEEIPFLYGQGWHKPLAAFSSEFALNKVADKSFRFLYPVRDIFIVIERRPLPASTVGFSSSAVVRADSTSWLARASVQRASLHFRVAQLLAAYQKIHNDLIVQYADDCVTVYRLPGALADQRK